MFKIGQKVVCVDDKNNNNPGMRRLYGSGMVTEGRIYTVRGALESDSGLIGLLLYEFRTRATHRNGNEVGFLVRRFRPIVSNSKKSERDKIINKLLSDCLKKKVGANA